MEETEEDRFRNIEDRFRSTREERLSMKEVREGLHQSAVDDIAAYMDDQGEDVSGEDVKRYFGRFHLLNDLKQYLMTDVPDLIQRRRTQTKEASKLYEQSENPPEWCKEVLSKRIPGFEEPYYFLDEGAYKITYVNHEEGKIVQLPYGQRNFEERLKQVLTWKRNAEVLQEHDIATASEHYEIMITEIRGKRVPLLVGDYKEDLVTLETRPEYIDEGEWNQIKTEGKELGAKVESLVQNGEIVSGAQQDYTHDLAQANMGYEPDKGVVVIDLGEFNPHYFKDNTVPYDSPEEYFSQTGLQEPIDRLTEHTHTDSEEKRSLIEEIRNYMVRR